MDKRDTGIIKSMIYGDESLSGGMPVGAESLQIPHPVSKGSPRRAVLCCHEVLK